MAASEQTAAERVLNVIHTRARLLRTPRGGGPPCSRFDVPKMEVT